MKTGGKFVQRMCPACRKCRLCDRCFVKMQWRSNGRRKYHNPRKVHDKSLVGRGLLQQLAVERLGDDDIYQLSTKHLDRDLTGRLLNGETPRDVSVLIVQFIR